MRESKAESEQGRRPLVEERWIVGVKIDAFRGISNQLEVEVGRAAERSSALIVGDNGTGKSSIVDAIQYALQGHFGQGGSRTVVARSAAHSRLPAVSVTFNDGTEIRRSLVVGEDGSSTLTEKAGDTRPFSRTPLVIRRRDILRFWETPAAERQLLFLPFFRVGPGVERETPAERATRLEAERVQAKSRRNAGLRKLQAVIHAKRNEIPADLAAFNSWVDKRFYGGWDPVRRRLRDKKRLPPDEWRAITHARAAITDLRDIERQLDSAKRSAEKPIRNRELAEVLAEASDDVTAAFKAISPHDSINRIDLSFGDETAVALDLSITLSNGRTLGASDFLSEANQDLVALLVYVAISQAAAARGQARVLLLDDVFQSVDAPIRTAALNYLVARLRGWQLIVTAHDRLWQEQVTESFRNANVVLRRVEILAWTLEEGPDVRDRDGDYGAALRAALKDGDPSLVAVVSGRTLEQMSDTLSWILNVSVKRRRDDRYTLADLWPPVRKVLGKTKASSVTAEIDEFLHLRNLIGAHPNAWAQGVSRTEATRFGKAILALLVYVRCQSCDRWIEGSPQKNTWVCRCGATVLSFESQ
jgi:hypothetical protein